MFNVNVRFRVLFLSVACLLSLWACRRDAGNGTVMPPDISHDGDLGATGENDDGEAQPPVVEAGNADAPTSHAPAASGSDTSPADPSASDSDTTMAVDVGNPKDTGPDQQGKLRFKVADAAIADTAKAVIIRPLALVLFDASLTPRATITLPKQDINLLDYQEGRALTLVDQDIAVMDIAAVSLILDPDAPVMLISPHDVAEPVLVPPVTGMEDGYQGPRLMGTITTRVAEGGVTDVTMHIDLRKTLRPIDMSLPVEWLSLSPTARYWLSPRHPTFLSQTVGAIRGLGLEGFLSQVVCAFPDGSGLIGIDGGDSQCAAAASSALIKEGSFYLGYMAPGSYALRIYLTDSLFVNVPGVYSVTAGTVHTLDLSGILGGLLGNMLGLP